VCILSTEYNADTHRRVFAQEYAEEYAKEFAEEYAKELAEEYAEEKVEEKLKEKMIEIAKTLLKIGDPIDKIIMVTGLPRETIEGIQI